jgi:alpha-L-rhamnosidase
MTIILNRFQKRQAAPACGAGSLGGLRRKHLMPDSGINACCILLLATVAAVCAGVPTGLRTEMLVAPLGLHTPAPRFSWRMEDPATGARQTAWQLQASNSEKTLERAELWDSGKVVSEQSHLVPYAGKPLRSRQRVYWRVRTWDQNGRPSDWSQPAWFELGLVDSTDWTARWIQPQQYAFFESGITETWRQYAVLRTPGGTAEQRDEEVRESLEILRQARPLVVARKTFRTGGNPGEARLYLAALGFANVQVNGRSVSDEWNTPAPTHYKIAARYKVFDISRFLRAGDNVIAVELAAGKYNELPGNHVRPFGDRPALKLQIEYLEGGRRVTVGTDESWKMACDPRNPLVNFWAGSVVDGAQADATTPGFDDSAWPGAVLGTEHESKRLLPMLIPPETTAETVRPVKQWKVADGVWVFDFGRTVVGRVQLDLPEADGRTHIVRYADSLRNTYSPDYERGLAPPDYPGRELPETVVGLGLKRRGNILFRNVGGISVFTAVPTDLYASPSSGPARYAPRFGMVPFRYMEVIGFDKQPEPQVVSANIAHTALPQTGTFRSSDENLNRIHEAVVRTLLYNAHGFYYDNNGAEKGFWPHTYGMNLPHFAFNCDVAAYTAYILEEVELFTREEGFTTTALSGRRGEKGAARFGFLSDGDYHVKLPYLHYLYSGDGKPLAKHGNQADAFVHSWWFAGRFPTPLLVDHYGDHTANSANLDVPASAFLSAPTKGRTGSVNQNNIASELSCTIYAAHLLDLAAILSDLKGDRDQAARRRAKRDETREAIRGKYYWNAEYGYAVDCLSAQGPNAAMIFYQVAPASEHPDLVRAVREDIKRWNKHLSTGSRLTYPLFSVLSSNGFLDEAVEMLTTRRYPSFLSMLDYADTLSESWPMPDAPATTSHCQTEGYSEIGKWFWHDLQGIHPDLDNPGFKHFFLKPRFPAKLDSAAAEFHSAYGPVTSAWTREGTSIRWNVTVPWNASATVSLPEFEARRVRLNNQTVHANAFKLSSGNHRIEVHQ